MTVMKQYQLPGEAEEKDSPIKQVRVHELLKGPGITYGVNSLVMHELD